jgi:hypothetical protein
MKELEFNKTRWSKQTRIKFDDMVWKVGSVNFDTGVLVLHRLGQYRVSVHYADCEIMSE